MRPPELRSLGQGTFGRVYLAHDDSLGEVAVKVLLDPTADLDRFAREAAVLHEHINNRHVVDIYRWVLSAPEPFLVLEYCAGPPLRSWVGLCHWRTAAMVLLHAGTGLVGIHGAGGFHRDLKPENLLLARPPSGDGWIVKVSDFGLARRPRTTKPPMTRTIGGTEGYIAPDLHFTPAADVYSLGAIGVELMTGQLTPTALAFAVAPQELKNLLTRMMSPVAWLRPSTADVVITLGQLLGPPEASTTDAPSPPPAPRPMASAPAAPARDNGAGWGWLLVGGLAVAAAALAAGNVTGWDDNVGRYRGSDGGFAGGSGVRARGAASDKKRRCPAGS